jgi:hypothetical protein
MTEFDESNGVIVIPELQVGTRFKIKNWVKESDFPEGNPTVEFEVMEALPDDTGYVPCHCESHQCAFDGLCGASIECPCSARERKDGKNVRYVEFINGEEYNF